MNPETSHWLAIGAGLVIQVAVALVVLHMRNEVLNAVNAVKDWAHSTFETKEMAESREEHLRALISVRRPHGTS